MAVSKEELAQYVAELGLPQEQTDAMVTTLFGNEKAATQFVGQRLRHSDYTKKTQDLATHRQAIESQATEQITAYATQLADSQNKINTIMKDLETEQISAATANARLRGVKERYNLSDQDIPAVEGVAKPVGTANANQSVDIDKKLADFGSQILKTLRQDMMSMPRITAIQTDIMEEHRELTGKRMSRAEMNDLIGEAEKNKTSLENAWRDKYKVDDLRLGRRDEENKKKWESEWEAARKAKASEEALSGVRARTDSGQTISQSPVIGRKYNEHSDPARAPVADKSQPQQPQPQQSGARLSGAERAAAKFLERRANGIPLGSTQS